jgi:hypothetical protein
MVDLGCVFGVDDQQDTDACVFAAGERAGEEEEAVVSLRGFAMDPGSRIAQSRGRTGALGSGRSRSGQRHDQPPVVGHSI